MSPAEDRGRTTIADRVIEAMAARITSDEPGVGGAARRVLGVAVTGEDTDRAPRVEATVAGEVVSLRVRLSVTYPAPVHTMTDRVRRRLIDRIGALTGMQVGVVDIVVVALHRPDTAGRVVR
ncbi:MAG: Asp23/Gls24 family envelope stress response protein [Pseudonocardiaceae bacterium]